MSNSLRVIKTVKQTNTDGSLSYVDCVKGIIAKDGVKGLFGRGLTTRLLTNMLQSMVFSVGWKARGPSPECTFSFRSPLFLTGFP